MTTGAVILTASIVISNTFHILHFTPILSRSTAKVQTEKLFLFQQVEEVEEGLRKVDFAVIADLIPEEKNSLQCLNAEEALWIQQVTF